MSPALVDRALDQGYNVALIGTPEQAAAAFERLRFMRAHAHRVDARGARSADELLWRTARALSGVAPAQRDGTRAALQALRFAVGHRPVDLLIDALEPAIAHAVFGRMRDDLWGLPVRWVLAVAPADRAVALKAPADAFFQVVRSLEP